MMYQIVIAAAVFGAALGEVFGTSCQVGQMAQNYNNSCHDQIGVGSIVSNSRSKIISCFQFPHPESVSNSAWVDIINIDCEPSSLLLANTTEHYWNETDECRIFSNINPKLTLTFVNRVTLGISVESDELMRNISCNFNVWRHHNCSNLSALTQGRLPVCHYKNYSVSINITFTVNGEIYLNDEPQIINQYGGNESVTTSVKRATTYNSLGDRTTMPTLTTSYDHHNISSMTVTTSYSHNVNINPPSITAITSHSTNSTMTMDNNIIIVTSPSIAGLIVGVACSVLVIGTLICISIAVLLIYIRRKSARRKQSFEDQNNPYSLTQVHYEESHQSQLQANANQYEQFHLSSSTEFIPSTEGEAASSMSTQPELQPDFRGIYSSIDTVQPKPVSQEMKENDPMYDVVGKGNDDKKQHEDSHDIVSNYQDIAKTKDTTSITEEGSPSTPLHVVDIQAIQTDPKCNETVEGEEASPIPHSRVEELYTVVKKNPKGNEKDDSEVAPPLPPHTVEELYTAVIKKPKSNAENKEQIPPPDSVEELYTAVVKKPKGNAEDEDNAPPIPPHSVEEHTAVSRNSKDNQENDSEEVALPIPPHTVEELYTAVMKKPKESETKDGEEAPPIPPYTVDKLSCSSDNDK